LKPKPVAKKSDPPVTLTQLTYAIKNSVDRKGLPEEHAKGMAQHILNFFGYEDRIIDNILEVDDRDQFYMLEDSGILDTQRDETTLYDGREWRIKYWLLRKDNIAKLAEAQKEKEEENIGAIYQKLSEEAWIRNGEKASASD